MSCGIISSLFFLLLLKYYTCSFCYALCLEYNCFTMLTSLLMVNHVCVQILPPKSGLLTPFQPPPKCQRHWAGDFLCFTADSYCSLSRMGMLQSWSAKSQATGNLQTTFAPSVNLNLPNLSQLHSSPPTSILYICIIFLSEIGQPYRFLDKAKNNSFGTFTMQS